MKAKMVMGPDQMPGWFEKYQNVMREINRQILRGLENPGRGLSLDRLQMLIEHRNPFVSVPGSVDEQLSSWRQFYLEEFVIELGAVDFPMPGHPFHRVIAVVKGITAQRVYDQCQKHFQCWKYTDRSLDEIVVHNDRSSQNGAYVIRIRDRIEADEEFKNLSANQLKRKGHQGITLTERLLYELKYFKETGKHPDTKNVTLCTGSRSDYGGVPRVRWAPDDRRMCVDWYSPGSANDVFRSREAVS